MTGTHQLDYSRFIETLNRLDDDADCQLSEEQFKQLLEEYPISQKEGYIAIAYKGLRHRKTGAVSFNDIRVLYEAQITAPMSKAMLIILFRGVASHRDRRVTLAEYKTIASFSQQSYDEKAIEESFQQLDTNKTGKVTYPQVANSLFNIKVKPNENPYKEILQVVSPHTGCCLLI